MQAMWAIVEHNAPRIERASQAEAQHILVALRARVAAAKQKEAVTEEEVCLSIIIRSTSSTGPY